jgi:hypothetical protein
MDGECKTHGQKRNAYYTVVGRLEWKRLLERPRRIKADNIKMDPKEIEFGMFEVHLSYDRDQWRNLVDTVIDYQVLIKDEDFLAR